ncbi:MAG TPA: YhcN/YlaJ family sporulation lipoprotein [Bacilli bacterium]
MKEKLWKIGLIGVLAATSLTGCMTRQGTDTGNRVQTNNVKPFNTPFRMDNRGGANTNALHNNTRMEVSQDIADRIAALREVDRAYVLLTDRNAYVAITLADNARMTGPRARVAPTAPVPGGTTRTGLDNAPGRMNRVTDRTTPFRTPGFVPEPNRAGIRTDVGNRVNNGVNGNRMAVDDVNNALRNRIASIVQSRHPVRNVYISANPGFVERMSGYARHLRNGQPIRGAIVEFNRMVERLFPDRAGTNRNILPSPFPNRNMR